MKTKQVPANEKPKCIQELEKAIEEVKAQGFMIDIQHVINFIPKVPKND